MHEIDKKHINLAFEKRNRCILKVLCVDLSVVREQKIYKAFVKFSLLRF